MRAATIVDYGAPEVIRIQEQPAPTCGEHDLLVEVHASAMNPVDWKIRSGRFRAPREFPIIPGYDVSGVVQEVGAQAEGFSVGDSVYAFCDLFRSGAHAELIAVDARVVAPKPRTVDHTHAAAIPLAVVTAWHALYERCQLQSGETVLIEAGAGGVGHLAIQLAKLRGARVIATASRDESIRLCQQLGADDVLNYQQEDIAEGVRQRTGGRGCEVALDGAGGEAFTRAIGALAPEARIATIVGVPQEADLSPLFLRNGTLHTVFIGSAAMFGGVEPRHARLLREVADLIDAAKLQVHVSQTVALEDLARAHQLQESGHVTGKIAIAVRDRSASG